MLQTHTKKPHAGVWREGLTRAIRGPRCALALALLRDPKRQSCRLVEPNPIYNSRVLIPLCHRHIQKNPMQGFFRM